jgi:hypothetical protein
MGIKTTDIASLSGRRHCQCWQKLRRVLLKGGLLGLLWLDLIFLDRGVKVIAQDKGL